jgi:hypothetical protein
MSQKVLLSSIGIIAVIFVLSYVVLPMVTKDTYEPLSAKAKNKGDEVLGTTTMAEEKLVIKHIPTPEAVKAIYMSQCVVGTTDFRQRLVDIVDTTEVNALIIDVKDYTGRLSFRPDDPALAAYVSDACGALAKDGMKNFIEYLHSKNIYVIGRVTTFQDPHYSKLHPEAALKSKSTGEVWKDKKGLAFLDPGSQAARDHVVAIAKASYAIGFDEINFDYVRYPSDGNVSDIQIPASALGSSKPQVLEDFFSYLHNEMKAAGIVTSADLFGMTTTNFDDLGIGQVLERALPYFDYIIPMVYPSHYPPNFNGWKNPNTVVYELIHYVMKHGVERTVASSSPINVKGSVRIGTSTPALYTKEIYDKNKLRTWIQDFDYGGDYGPTEVRDQIQASYDVGLTSWLIWSPSNKYTVEALLKP